MFEWLFGKKEKEVKIQPNCVDLAFMRARTYGRVKNVPTRIAVNRIPGSKDDHAQAQAKIEGTWTPLTEVWKGDHLEIIPYKRHYDVEPYRYVELWEWVVENFKYSNQRQQ